MRFIETPLKGAYIIEPEPFVDARGFFARTFCENEFSQHGLHSQFVQTNHSGSFGKGIIRGMHYQLPPHAEVKLIKCIRGSIQDVIIDVRKNSPTFLQWFEVELSDENKKMLYVPKGFAHGFQTLESHIEVIYQVSNSYHPASERGIRYNDPIVGIKWRLDVTQVSDKDQGHPLLDDSFEGVTL